MVTTTGITLFSSSYYGQDPDVKASRRLTCVLPASQRLRNEGPNPACDIDSRHTYSRLVVHRDT